MTRDEIIKLMDWHPSIARDGLDGLLARVEWVVRKAEKDEREATAMAVKESLQRLGVDWAITEAVMKDIRARRTSTISPATLIDPRGSLGEPIV
jgi:ribosomal protein S18 acetylase RimI-like enzyme